MSNIALIRTDFQSVPIDNLCYMRKPMKLWIALIVRVVQNARFSNELLSYTISELKPCQERRPSASSLRRMRR